jgi:tetratricopeptide (TPR) repeat protein
MKLQELFTGISKQKLAKLLPKVFLLLVLCNVHVLTFAQIEVNNTIQNEQAAEVDSLSSDEAISTEEQAQALAYARELQIRQSAIIEMQSNLGIYDPALIEAYGDLGKLFSDMEDYQSAIQVYGDALQVARTNTGLYSEEQLPVIASLIDSNSELKAWSEVDNWEELSYHIASRLFEFTDPRYMTSIEGYGGWKLRVMRENLLEQSFQGLNRTASDLSRFYEKAIVGMEMQAGLQPESLMQVIYGKSQVDLSIARAVARTPYTAFQGTANPYINQTRCRNIRNSQGVVVRSCYTVQVENPRYRQSQRDAKRFEMSRHTREMVESIDRLRSIKDQSTTLSSLEKQQLEIQIAELEAEFEQLLSASRRINLF